MLHTILSFCFILLVVGVDGRFGVYPSKIVVRINETFTIQCFLDSSNGNLLYFYDEDNHSIVDEQFINRFNSTFIEVTQSTPIALKKNLTCKRGSSSIGSSNVYIDGDTPPVKHFNCTTENLKKLECLFKVPTHVAPIRYDLKYSSDENQKLQKLILKVIKGGIRNATFDISKFSANSTLKFHLNSENSLSNLKQEFQMVILETVKPQKVVKNDLSTETLTNSANISFHLPQELEIVKNEIEFEILLWNEFDESFEQVVNPEIRVDSNGKHFLTFHDLKYSNADYELKIRIKSKKAQNVEDKWSAFEHFFFKTKPKKPIEVPKTCENCFNVKDNGDVVLYWTIVPRKFQNAEGFHFTVKVMNDTSILEEIKTNETSLLIRESWTEKNIKVFIYSENDEGISNSHCQFVLPKERFRKHIKFLKVYKELMNGEFNVSWRITEPETSISNYTVFWCSQRNELANQCDDAINFSFTTSKSFSIKASKLMQFGVAANFKDSTSGLIWARCTSASSNEIGQVHSLWGSAESKNSMDLKWRLNCEDETIVTGYNITYCLLANYENSTLCVSDVKSDILHYANGNEIKDYRIQNLKTFSRYKIQIALMSASKLGVPKEPIFKRTLEGAPTEPRNLKLLNVEDNSIAVSWDRPLLPNGEAMSYQFWINEERIIINSNDTKNETFHFVYKSNLKPYTNYKITIIACNKDCSNQSETLNVTTKITNPDIMLQPFVSQLDKNLIVEWEYPDNFVINYGSFQLKTVIDGVVRYFNINSKLKSCEIRNIKCLNDGYEISIRAMNYEPELPRTNYVEIADDCQLFEEKFTESSGVYFGQWSPSITFYCDKEDKFLLIIEIFAGILLTVLILYMMLKFYRRIEKMKDIHVVLPIGIRPDLMTSTTIPEQNKHKTAHMNAENYHEYEYEYSKESDKFLEPSNENCRSPVGSLNSRKQEEKFETLQPFIVNPITNEISYTFPKLPMEQKPTNSDYCQQKDSHVDEKGYMKMRKPKFESTQTSPTVEGYLDMSGKSPSRNQQLNENLDYQEIKNFIRDSEINNDGYIGKRISVLSEKNKPEMFINANGYVGLKK